MKKMCALAQTKPAATLGLPSQEVVARSNRNFSVSRRRTNRRRCFLPARGRRNLACIAAISLALSPSRAVVASISSPLAVNDTRPQLGLAIRLLSRAVGGIPRFSRDSPVAFRCRCSPLPLVSRERDFGSLRTTRDSSKDHWLISTTETSTPHSAWR